AGQVADSRSRRNANGALRRDLYLGLNHILSPIAPAGGYISRKRENLQRRKCDIVRSSNTSLQTAAAPHGDASFATQLMNSHCRRITPYAAQLDIYDLASAQLDRSARMLFGVDTLVETNRRIQATLQFRVAIDVIPTKRLLDHHQVV